MAPFDLVMVDEFSLLTKKQFERLMKQWQAAEKIPALLFLGDKLQLPGMGDERAWHHPAWNKELKHCELRRVWR
eukprot:10084327-Karenia_brevis.AAC.1